MRSSLRRAPHSLFPDKEERDRSADPDGNHDFVVADEIRKNHQPKSEKHRLPEAHSLSVDERDETDRAKHKTADQVCRAEVHNVDLAQLVAGQDRLAAANL